MELPLGPPDVGLEPIVLPCAVEVDARDPGWPSIALTAPTCRYGDAYYLPRVIASSGSVYVADDEDTLVGGWHGACGRPPGAPPVRVELHIVSLWLAPGAFDDIGTTELLEALTHPLANVRLAAVVALSR